MIINSTLLLLTRSVSTALLAMLGLRYVVLYFVNDMLLHFVYKIMRGDFWHWLPLEGAASLFESII
jgi:hypothetical protein